MVSRLIGFSLLLGAGACASANTYETRAMLAPKNGPKAHVYVSYFGGMTNRTVRTTFRTDQNAHVIVGRLGGDGRVEILYPETPKSPTLVAKAKTYSARTFASSYDALPQLYSYASRMPRAYGARADSYDGLGNGFIFIIATQYPMFTDALDDHGMWSDSLTVDDYYTSNDPRYAIRDFAEVLTRGMPYSLDYASSFTTSRFSSYADAAMDCQLLQSAFGSVGSEYQLRMMNMSLGFMGSSFDPLSSYFGGFDAWHTGFSPYVGCGNAYDRRYLAFGAFRRSGWGYGYGYGWGPTIPVNPVTPAKEPTTKFAFNTLTRRPGFRNGSESGSAINVTRPRFDGQRQKPTNTNSWAPPIQQTRTTIVDRNDHFDRSNSSRNYSPGATGSTRTEGVTSFHQPTTPVAAPTPAPAPRELPVSHPVSRPERPKDP